MRQTARPPPSRLSAPTADPSLHQELEALLARLESLTERLATRAGHPIDVDYSKLVEGVRGAGPEQIRPLVEQFRKAVTDMESAVRFGSAPRPEHPGADDRLRARATSYDEEIRADLQGDEGSTEGFTVL